MSNRPPDARVSTAVGQRQPGARSVRADAWRARLPLAGLAVTYALSWWANANWVLNDAGPTIAGVVASIAFVAAWLWYAVASVRNASGGLKLATAYWGLAIVGLVVAGLGVRGQTLSGGALTGWGYLLMAVFYLLAIPIYGLVAWWPVSPRWLLYAAVAMVCYLLVLVSAALARRSRSARDGLVRGGARPGPGA